jgi:molybdopterin converting factor small subunit
VARVSIKTEEGVRGSREKASCVGELLDVLRKKDKRLAAALVDGMAGRIFTVVKVNGKDVRFLRHLDTPLSEDDEVDIELCSRDRDGRVSELYLTFHRDALGQPLISTASRMFGLVINIRGASISTKRGFAHVQVEGPAEEIGALVEWLKAKGVEVEETQPRRK